MTIDAATKISLFQAIHAGAFDGSEGRMALRFCELSEAQITVFESLTNKKFKGTLKVLEEPKWNRYAQGKRDEDDPVDADGLVLIVDELRYEAVLPDGSRYMLASMKFGPTTWNSRIPQARLSYLGSEEELVVVVVNQIDPCDVLQKKVLERYKFEIVRQAKTLAAVR